MGYFGPKRSKYGPNDQTHKKRPKEPNKVTFSCGLRPWVRIFHKILKSNHRGSKKFSFGQNRTKLDLNNQIHFYWPRKPNKVTFPDDLKSWVRISYKMLGFSLQWVKKSSILAKIRPNLDLSKQIHVIKNLSYLFTLSRSCWRFFSEFCLIPYQSTVTWLAQVSNGFQGQWK